MMSGTKLSEELLMRLIISAFPIMVFKAQLPDSSRKYMQVFEALKFNPVTNILTGNMLFQYLVEGRVLSEDSSKIIRMIGKHQQLNKISNDLANRLITNGCDLKLVKKYANPQWNAGEVN
ncbi:hypothetical protein [Clostridium sp. 'deep sea']|uniref:hypothetical protein n=1 Tax=Clostridium sp. 'deep sea' TaxID=2779445 RepID=UPI001A9B9635|nr:hypothetical protein [Clostridium sp. 'deep sea']